MQNWQTPAYFTLGEKIPAYFTFPYSQSYAKKVLIYGDED